MFLKKKIINFFLWRLSGFQGRVRGHAQLRVPRDFLLKRVRASGDDWLVLRLSCIASRETRVVSGTADSTHCSPTGKMALRRTKAVGAPRRFPSVFTSPHGPPITSFPSNMQRLALRQKENM